MKLVWIANSRPDCLFEIAQLAQVTEGMFTEQPTVYIKRFNKAIKYAIDNITALKVSKLDAGTLKIVGFSDASFANNYDLSSQLGYIIFLGNRSDTVVPLVFRSYKARRISHSAMSGEVIAFSDMFDYAIAISKDIAKLLGRTIPIQLLTDSKSLFDVISKGSRTSEKRMMLDIAAAREGFRDKIISGIGFIRSSTNVADGLTKRMAQASLRTVIATGQLHIYPEQWIVRKE